jgi:hypothetical protein
MMYRNEYAWNREYALGYGLRMALNDYLPDSGYHACCLSSLTHFRGREEDVFSEDHPATSFQRAVQRGERAGEEFDRMRDNMGTGELAGEKPGRSNGRK